MKPNFALNFTDTSIALLHRTAKGWLKIGETPFDAPDLTEALDYLRKTALGLEPQGFATKLVIPNSQILYAEVEATGPDAESRLEQIAAALETRTPLTRDEMIFDWAGDGPLLQVAAVARETLAEAEDFATTHRFNPVSFVAIPENGTYLGEPWFGPTAAAPGLIDSGEAVERDAEAIMPLAEGGRRAKAAVQPEPEPETAPQPEPEPEPEPTPVPAPDPGPDPSLPPELPEPPAPAHPAPSPAPEIPQQPAPQSAPEPEPIPAPEPEIPAAPGPEIVPGPNQPEIPAGEPWMGARAAPQPVPAAESEPRATTTPQPEARPAAAPTGLGLTVAGVRPAAIPPAARSAEADEAPFTHVADPEPAAEPLPDEELAISPAAQIAAAAAATPARDTTLQARPAVAVPAEPDDDLPPAPPPAVTAAFATRRQIADAAGAGAPTLPAATRPDAATLARAARGKPIEELPPLPRAPQPAARAVASGTKGVMKSLGATAGASRKVKGKPPVASAPGGAAAGRPAGAAAAGTANPAAASRSLGNTPFALRQPQRGKPRFLGLILTAILLVCLALVAAWSSFYLARNDMAEETAVAAADLGATGPAVEDEMAADGIDEADLAAEAGAAADSSAADEVSAGAEVPALAPAAPETVVETAAETVPEPAPETTVPADSPAAVALVDPQDEIFLSAADAPPPAFDPLSLPEPVSGAEAAPTAPMPPPAFGTVFQFDGNGQIVPQAEGITTPGGYTLYAGKPDKIPPSRSAAAEKAAADARTAAAAAAAAMEAAPVVSETAAATEGETVPAVPVGESASAEAALVQNPNPDLADRRPRLRPEDLAPAEDDGALIALPEGAQKASLRPRARPATILAAGEKARAETAAASLAGDAPAPGAEVELASAAVNPSVLMISRRPAPRPEDFSRAVEAAVAAAVRMPEPEPEPAPKKKSKAAAAAPEVKPEEQSEIDEPEVASAAPKIPTKASVAKQATFKNAINLSKVNLIGVYGTPSKRYALVRLANGKYKKVRVGDRIDGGTVQAITQTEVRYQKGGRLVALAMPRG